MCGIVGICNLTGSSLPDFDPHAVLDTIAHRGPDDEGIFRMGGVFLGSRRLAIIDPLLGHQPMNNESDQIVVVMNGEIFDYDLLLKRLKERGHVFKSHCDTEVLVHLLEEKWSGALDDIDGQYAIAAYDTRTKRLLLVRDRMGICPLFYAQVGRYLVFASEMKAIFATGLIRPEIMPRSLDAVLAFGTTPAPHTMFKGIRALKPGHFLDVHNGVVTERMYWDIPYNDAGDYPRRPMRQWAKDFRNVLSGACHRRLKADVPVGVYLSGGIDSSAIAALTADAGNGHDQAFTIGFPEPGFDESFQARQLAKQLGMNIHVLEYHQEDLARDLWRLVYHGETPVVSTESVPLLALSQLAHQYVKVVLTGEGSDEALGGYIYFRWEALKRAMGDGLGGALLTWLARPCFRRILGERNPFIPQPRDSAWAEQLFGYYPAIMMKFFYFRMVRQLVYSPDMLRRQENLSDAEFLNLPLDRMQRWEPYNRTLYLSSRIFMSNYLLGAHGDRALMANSVEGRYPFLDRQVQEFLAAVPPAVKTIWWDEKRLLRRAMAGRLPRAIIHRKKKLFLAPLGTPFVGPDCTESIRDLLTPRRLREFGYFDPAKVQKIVDYIVQQKQAVSEDRKECMRADHQAIERLIMGMALTFVVSTQVLAQKVHSGQFNCPAPNVALAR